MIGDVGEYIPSSSIMCKQHSLWVIKIHDEYNSLHFDISLPHVENVLPVLHANFQFHSVCIAAVFQILYQLLQPHVVT